MSENQSHPVRELTTSPSQFQSSAPYRVLVVDDDISIRRLNAEVLTQSGYEVDAAEDGVAAWETLQVNGYDLMITDQRMPKLGGIDLLKKLRAARMALPVIMATGTIPEAMFACQPWLRPAAVLLKPYTIPELLGAVRQVLSTTDYPPEQINALLTWRGSRLHGSASIFTLSQPAPAVAHPPGQQYLPSLVSEKLR